MSAIAESDALGNENESDGDEDEDDIEGEGAGWRSVDAPQAGETVVKAGYLWKKGVRRKVSNLFLIICIVLMGCVTDMEKAMVCSPADTSGLLQG